MRQRFAPQNLSLVSLSMAASLLCTVALFADEQANNLQLLVNDTAAQIQLAYRRLPNEQHDRQAQLEAVVAGWHRSTRSEVNNEQLATWLHQAILNSMPGSTKPLPPAPRFAASDKSVFHATEIAVKKTSSVLHGMPDDDPFRDDSVSANK
ncbi:MAG TPA: hypothetical protein VFW73_12785 [Lacipirellulaceae bacterium]|nr:hypothetical protein [Lacipirellulaceae bacterium]